MLLFRLGALALDTELLLLEGALLTLLCVEVLLDTELLLLEGALLTRLCDEVLLDTVLLLLAGAFVTDLFCELPTGFLYVFVLRVTVLLLGVCVTVLLVT